MLGFPRLITTSILLAAFALANNSGVAHTREAQHRSLDGKRAALEANIRKAAAAEYPGLDRDPYFDATARAIGQIHREDFVPADLKSLADRATPLPIGYDQTISDPYIVAIISAVARVSAGSNVLEIGTGSGYQAAVLSVLGAHIHSIEIVPELAKSAAARLKKLHYSRISIKSGDGFEGWTEFGPYDAIIVTAGAAAVPPALMAQLKTGGHLVMPIGASGASERLEVLVKQQDGALTHCSLGPVVFVPLTGRGVRTPSTAQTHGQLVPGCYPR